MPDIQIQLPDDSEQESPLGKKILRIGAIFLCVIFGIILIFMGYLLAIVLDFDYTVFANNTAVCFYVCFAIWILIGALTPFHLFQSFFEELIGIDIQRILLFVVVFGILIFLHWFVITITTEILVSIFSA